MMSSKCWEFDLVFLRWITYLLTYWRGP